MRDDDPCPRVTRSPADRGKRSWTRVTRVGAGAVSSRDDRTRDEGHALALAASEVQRRLRTAFPDISPVQVEDAVAEAVRQYLERDRNGMTPGGTLAVLRQLAVWNLHHHLRTERWRSPTPPGGIEQVRDSAPPVDQDVLRDEARGAVVEEHLVSRRSRTILSLWSLGYRIREIAMRVHIKAATVRKKKERAIRKIRKRLGGE